MHGVKATFTSLFHIALSVERPLMIISSTGVQFKEVFLRQFKMKLKQTTKKRKIKLFMHFGCSFTKQ